ncbi:MAG: hypothetical protein MJ252_09280 [archaeon]|nr:hypothetical protein [archaeon]
MKVRSAETAAESNSPSARPSEIKDKEVNQKNETKEDDDLIHKMDAKEEEKKEEKIKEELKKDEEKKEEEIKEEIKKEETKEEIKKEEIKEEIKKEEKNKEEEIKKEKNKEEEIKEEKNKEDESEILSFMDNILNLFYDKQSDKRIQGVSNLEDFIKKSKEKNTLKEDLQKIIKALRKLIGDKTKIFKEKLVNGGFDIIIKLHRLSVLYEAPPQECFEVLQVFFYFKTDISAETMSEFIQFMAIALKDKTEIVLANIDEVFNILYMLKLSQEQKERQISESINSLIKDTLVTYYHKDNFDLREKFKFDSENFNKNIIDKLGTDNYSLKLFIISWIEHMVKVSQLQLIKNYPKIINFLISEYGNVATLSDTKNKNKNSNQSQIENKSLLESAAKSCLNKIQTDIEINFEKYFKEFYLNFEETVLTIIDLCNITQNQTKKISFSFLEKILIGFKKMIEKNLSLKKEEKKEEKKEDILLLSPGITQSLFPSKIFVEILKIVLNMKSKEEQIGGKLKEIVEKTPEKYLGLNLRDVEDLLKSAIVKKEDSGLEILITWCNLLFNKYKSNLFSNIPEIINAFSEILTRKNDSLLFNMINFLCLITMQKEEYNQMVIYKLSDLFIENNASEEYYFEKILKQLCETLGHTFVFDKLSDKLMSNEDPIAISEIVIRIINYLISLDPNSEFRSLLRNYRKEGNEETKILFEKMFKLFSFNPVGSLILCLITEYFELSFNLILLFGDITFDEYYSGQMNQIVNLFEDKHFDNLRLRLAEPGKNLYLVKTLLGILMIIPQGYAYNALSNRIKCVETLLMMDDEELIEKDDPIIMADVNHLLEIFLEVQNIIKTKTKNIKINE